MGIGKDRAVARQLRTLFNVGTTQELTDGQLLERFATDRGEAAELAFAVLVERHGPMVLRVCRSVLNDAHDTQDAFQATFLVLVKKARGLWVRDSLGPWLHQVAYRTASCARTAAARRRRKERRAALTTEESRAASGDELGRMLHEEIDRLPERYRAPLVLCDLEGCTHAQAARHLGWPIGTVKSRQARARDRLRDRLRRRGLAPDAGLLAAALRPEALLPPALLDSTTRAVVQFVTIRTIVQGSAASLAQGVLRAMFLTRFLKVVSVLLVLGATGAGVDLLAQKESSGRVPRPEGNPPVARAEDAPASAVAPGKFSGTMSERGVVEAARNADVFSQVEGRTTILSIVPEGTWLQKGQIVCELDSSALRDQLNKQLIVEKTAEAAYQNAKLTREVAEIAVVEYVEWTYKKELDTLKGEIDAAQSAIQKADARLERTRRARERLTNALAPKGGATTPAEIVAELDVEDRLDAAEQALLREKKALELAKTKQKVFEQNVLEKNRDRTVKELQREVEKARSDERVKKQVWELEADKVAKLRKQVASCKILAPEEGLLVHANELNRLTGQLHRIEPGATVQERQKIFSMPDIRGAMRLNAKVHESLINRITNGMRARIKVDAFPGETLTGVVGEIAPLPDPSSPRNPDRRVYSTMVNIETRQRGLRPGMTAQVEISFPELEDVISVPASAVLWVDGRSPQVAVKNPDGGFDWRAVILGVSNDQRVEIRSGLRSGEVVIHDARALRSEEQQRYDKYGQGR